MPAPAVPNPTLYLINPIPMSLENGDNTIFNLLAIDINRVYILAKIQELTMSANI